MSGKEVIDLPAYFFSLRLAQIIIAILVLIVDIVSTAVLASYGAISFGIFTPIATCIIVVYWYYANRVRPQYYNRWAILILECFAVVWWLSLWSALASYSSALADIDAIDNAFGYDDGNGIRIVHILAGIAAALGAIEFILFVITLVSFSINLHRARKAERQGNQQIPFANPQQAPTYTNPQQQINNDTVSKPQFYHSNVGTEVSP